MPANATEAALAGDALEEEVVALFDRLRGPVLRYVLSLGLPPSDAEEIVQDAFVALFGHLRRGRPRVNLQGWIFRVAHNGALRHRRRRKRSSETFHYSPRLCAEAVDGTPGPERCLQQAQRRRRLLAVVQAMPENDQCCLSLRAEGLRYREIAEVLGISLGSVANAMARSLAKLERAEGEREEK